MTSFTWNMVSLEKAFNWLYKSCYYGCCKRSLVMEGGTVTKLDLSEFVESISFLLSVICYHIQGLCITIFI